VLDTTGSMDAALDNVKSSAVELVGQIVATGDYRLGLVTFHDYVQVFVDLAGGTADATLAALASLQAGGGNAQPEASDEAMATVLERLTAVDRAALPLVWDVGPPPSFLLMHLPRQLGDFTGAFRDEASKLLILVTDAPPGGFADPDVVFENGTIVGRTAADQTALDAARMHGRKMAAMAGANGVRIAAVFVPDDGGDYGRQAELMQEYAALSGGVFVQTAADASDLATQLSGVIATRACAA